PRLAGRNRVRDRTRHDRGNTRRARSSILRWTVARLHHRESSSLLLAVPNRLAHCRLTDERLPVICRRLSLTRALPPGVEPRATGSLPGTFPRGFVWSNNEVASRR